MKVITAFRHGWPPLPPNFIEPYEDTILSLTSKERAEFYGVYMLTLPENEMAEGLDRYAIEDLYTVIEGVIRWMKNVTSQDDILQGLKAIRVVLKKIGGKKPTGDDSLVSIYTLRQARTAAHYSSHDVDALSEMSRLKREVITLIDKLL